jgi:hypothetical protein
LVCEDNQYSVWRQKWKVDRMTEWKSVTRWCRVLFSCWKNLSLFSCWKNLSFNVVNSYSTFRLFVVNITLLRLN